MHSQNRPIRAPLMAFQVSEKKVSLYSQQHPIRAGNDLLHGSRGSGIRLTLEKRDESAGGFAGIYYIT